MRLAVVLVAALLGACAGSAASASADPWKIDGAVRDLPPDIERAEGRRGENGGTVFDPSSVHIEEGVAYRFSLGHCGLLSPVDVDGSFWEATQGFDVDGRPIDLSGDAEMINATSGVLAVVGDEMRFRTESGAVVHFARLFGPKEFGACD